MKKSFSTFFLSLFFPFFYFSQPESLYCPHQFLVQITREVQIDEVIRFNSLLNGSPTMLRLVSVPSNAMNIYLLEGNSTADENLLLRKIISTPGVTLAQFNHYMQERSTLPNDTYFGSMWSLNNTGQSGGTPDADIDAPEAWDISTGGLTAEGDSIVVAVVDGGFQLSHPDLSFWKNYDEIPGNGIDDDGNGYIDDINGWNAVSHSPSIGNNNHGTHVAGTIGAKGNSGTGTTGISWNVKVMAVQGSTGTEAIAVEAYDYILQTRRLYDQTSGQRGAFIVATNSSFGVDQGQPSNFPIWCAMYDSLGAAGILSAGATANQNWNIDVVGDIPTGCSSPYLISVTNTTRTDVKYTSAGYGINTIDLGAPGTSIYSTVPTSTWSMNNWTGTSMATPHVAGTLGLMYAAACQEFIQDYKLDPAGKALLMRNYLLNGVDTLLSMSNLCSTGGRLNAFQSLQQVLSYPACVSTGFDHVGPSTSPFIRGVFPNPFADDCELEYISAGGEIKFMLFDISGKLIREMNHESHSGYNRHTLHFEQLSAGLYLLSVQENNRQGNFIKLIKH